ncbi:MAG: glycerol kinase GlpK, partial [Erysipelotrichia bacterium]|nr:glycerol kinase GlpK [Erysipelotrichia bacterium]
MKRFILAIDQGTTSTRAILFDKTGKVRYQSQREVKCFYPYPGWVEQDGLQLWISVIDTVNEVLIQANITMRDVDSIGITNQRETTIVWDKATGLPVYPAIVWQSRQSSAICDRLNKQKDFIHQKTGLLINPYFSASKIRFILDNIPNGQARAKRGELLFGTVDSWIIYKMTKGRVHATDASNASRTMLFNINEMKWDKELCLLFDIPSKMLPEVKPSSDFYGNASFFNDSVPIAGVAGDQQAALFGQTCFTKGESKNTYGTGCFMLLNIGDKPLFSKKGLLTTVAWQIDGKVTYALEGSVFIGGAVVQWLRDEMEMIETATESERYALKVKDSNGIYIVPAFVGLGTPYWDNEARGAVFGLSRSANKSHFIRASLESIAYQCKDVIEVMKKESKIDVKTLKVDGGATENNYLLQFQSDILSTIVKVPQCLETTALG